RWIPDDALARLPIPGADAASAGGLFISGDIGIRFRDLDRDGVCEFLIANNKAAGAYRWDEASKKWSELRFSLPAGVTFASANRTDNGLRFVDIDEDGYDDIVFSNAERFGVYLFNDMQTGWSRVVVEGTRNDPLSEASGGRKPPGASNNKSVPQEQ